MIFKVFRKKELEKLFCLLSENKIIAPIEKGVNSHGQPIYDFAVVDDFAQVCIDYTVTTHSVKRFFLPYLEALCSFTIKPDSWEKHVDINVSEPLVIFGLHTCDINALNKLDKVLIDTLYPNPYYAGKRRNSFIVGVDCIPQPQCFCQSMNSDTVLQGFDMFLTDLGDKYFVEVLSATAFHFLNQIKLSDPDQRDHDLYKEVIAAKQNSYTTTVDCTDLTKILDMEFDAEVWKLWGEKCLSCGTCANVCPTCYCYGVKETINLNLKEAHKIRQLYSCNLLDFSQIAGGHNFRSDSHTRLKYRYYHKHRGFVETFEEPLCVGCGRCGRSCLANITVPEVIASVRNEGKCHVK